MSIMNDANPTLVSTQQALKVLARRFPGFKTAPQLNWQIRKGTLRVAARLGKKHYFLLADILAFIPSYEGQGRNSRPPTWNGNGFTISEAAHLLKVDRNRLANMRSLGKLEATKIAGIWSVSHEEIERLRSLFAADKILEETRMTKEEIEELRTRYGRRETL